MTNTQLAKYKDMAGTEVVLTKNDITNVLTNGSSHITEGEIKTFVELCRAHKLNPFLKEAYIVKYGNKPATLLVGKDAFTKRAQANPKFRGMQAGLCLIDKNGNYIERAGSMILDGERIAGGWAKVFVEGYVEPVYDSVSFNEYAQKDAQGRLRSTWAKMPATMIRKVALVHALREAFPDDFSGMYDAAEIDTHEDAVQATPTQEPAAQPAPAQVVEAETIEPQTPLQTLQEAVSAYCASCGADYRAEIERIAPDGKDEQYLLQTAENYRAAIAN